MKPNYFVEAKELNVIKRELLDTLEELAKYSSFRSELRVSLTRLKEAIFWLDEGLNLLLEEGPEK